MKSGIGNLDLSETFSHDHNDRCDGNLPCVLLLHLDEVLHVEKERFGTFLLGGVRPLHEDRDESLFDDGLVRSSLDVVVRRRKS